MRFTRKPGALIGALAVGLAFSVPAQAGHDEDLHSDNAKLLVSKPIKVSKEIVGQGSDLAFDGKRVYAGSYQGTALFKIVKKKKGYLKQIGFHQCPGSQGDVSYSGKHVLVSIDSTAIEQRRERRLQQHRLLRR